MNTLGKNFYEIMYDIDLKDGYDTSILRRDTATEDMTEAEVADDTMVFVPGSFVGYGVKIRIAGTNVDAANTDTIKKFVAEHDVVKVMLSDGLHDVDTSADLEQDEPAAQALYRAIKYPHKNAYNENYAGKHVWFDTVTRHGFERTECDLRMTSFAPEAEQIKVTSNPGESYPAAINRTMYRYIYSGIEQLILVTDGFNIYKNTVRHIRTALVNGVDVWLVSFIPGYDKAEDARLQASSIAVKAVYSHVADQQADKLNQAFILPYKFAKKLQKVRNSRTEQYSELVTRQILDMYIDAKLRSKAAGLEAKTTDSRMQAIDTIRAFTQKQLPVRTAAQVKAASTKDNFWYAIKMKKAYREQTEAAEKTLKSLMKDKKDWQDEMDILQTWAKPLGIRVNTELHHSYDYDSFDIQHPKYTASYSGKYDYALLRSDCYAPKFVDYLHMDDENLGDIITAMFEIAWFRSNNVEQFLDDGYSVCPFCGQVISDSVPECKCGASNRHYNGLELVEGNPEYISGSITPIRPERSLTNGELEFVEYVVALAKLPKDRHAVVCVKQLMKMIARKYEDAPDTLYAPSTAVQDYATILQKMYFNTDEAEEQVAVAEDKPAQTDMFAQFQDTKCYLSKAAVTAYIKFYSVRKAEAKAARKAKSNKNKTKLIEVTTEKGNKYSIYVAK